MEKEIHTPLESTSLKGNTSEHTLNFQKLCLIYNSVPAWGAQQSEPAAYTHVPTLP